MLIGDKTHSTIDRYGHVAAFVILGVLVFAVYSNTFHAPFIFDDEPNIRANYRITSLSYFWPPFGTRYLAFLSFALNYRINGLEVFGYHLANTAIHLVNSFLVYILALLTFKTPVMRGSDFMGESRGAYYAALLAAAVYAAHPVQTEAVTYIVQRVASLAALFYLLSISLFVWWRLRYGAPGSRARLAVYALAIVFELAAQMTKEISLTLPVMIAVYDAVFFNDVRGVGRRLKYLFPFLLILAVIPFAIISMSAGGGVGAKIGELVAAKLTPYEYLINQFRVMMTYLRLLVLPVNLTLDYDYPVYHSIAAASVFLSLLFLLALGVLTLYVFIRSCARGEGYLILATFGIFWFFITLSVESSVIPINDLIYEHRLYLPLAGPALSFVSVVFYLSRRLIPDLKPLTAAVAVFLAVVVPLGAAANMRNYVWGDTIRFWEDAVRKSPNKARVHINLGGAYRSRGRIDDEITELKEAIRLDPKNALAHLNLGMDYGAKGLDDLEAAEFKEVLRRYPDNATAHSNMAGVYYRQGRADDAISELKEAIRLDPDSPFAKFNLAVIYEERGEIDKAIESYQAFVDRTAPYHPQVKKAREAIVQLKAMKRQ